MRCVLLTARSAPQAFAAVDGVTSGFDSEEEVEETPEQRFERENPDVPVVRNLEDMWMVTKMQQELKRREAHAAWMAERAKRAAEKTRESEGGANETQPTMENTGVSTEDLHTAV